MSNNKRQYDDFHELESLGNEDLPLILERPSNPVNLPDVNDSCGDDCYASKRRMIEPFIFYDDNSFSFKNLHEFTKSPPRKTVKCPRPLNFARVRIISIEDRSVRNRLESPDSILSFNDYFDNVPAANSSSYEFPKSDAILKVECNFTQLTLSENNRHAYKPIAKLPNNCQTHILGRTTM